MEHCIRRLTLVFMPLYAFLFRCIKVQISSTAIDAQLLEITVYAWRDG